VGAVPQVPIGDIVSLWKVDLAQGVAALRRLPEEVRKVQAAADQSLEKISSAARKTSTDLASGLSKGLTGAGQAVSKFRGELLVMGAATGAVVGKAVHAFGEWETQSKAVQNVTGMSTEKLRDLQKQLLSLPPALGKPTDMIKGLYGALQAGVPEDNALTFIVANAKAAKGNMADLAQTVDATTSVMNAYGLQGEEINRVLDGMTKAVDLGKLEFSDLADNIGKGISIAAAAGVEYEELFAILATLTLSGLKVDEAMTAVKGVLTAALSPTKETSDAMADLGVDLSTAAIKSKGLVGVMGEVAKATKGDSDLTAALFGNIRALNGALALTSEQGLATFGTALEGISDSAGKVESNYNNMVDSVEGRSAEFAAQMEEAWIRLGEQMRGAFLPLIEGLSGLLEKFNALDPAAQKAIGGTLAFVAGATALLVVIGPLLTGLGKVVGLFAGASGVAGAAGAGAKALGAFGAVLAGPAGVIAAVVAMGLAFGVALKAILDMTGASDKITELFGLAASQEQEFAAQLTKDDEAYARTLSHYQKMKEALELTGDEWSVQADHTANNASKLAVLYDRVSALYAKYRDEHKTDQQHTEDLGAQASATDQVKAALAAYGATSAETADKLKKAFKVMTAGDLESAAQVLTDSMVTLAQNGVPAAELLAAMGPEVQALAERSKNFTDAKLPDEFTNINDAVGLGIDGMKAWVDSWTKGTTFVAMTVKEQMTAMATSLQLSLDENIAGGFQGAMTKAMESGKTEISNLQAWIEANPLKAEVLFDLEDLRRALREMGLSPDTSGSLP